jgi:metal-responsive CopG/Arc/MetJ family transcriptional regulator
MQTIQVVLDEDLLKAADQAARQMKKNRSQLMREALRQHLRRLEIRAMEEREREGYAKHPQTLEEIAEWEAEAVWPAE